jgi:hypothetical protein
MSTFWNRLTTTAFNANSGAVISLFLLHPNGTPKNGDLLVFYGVPEKEKTRKTFILRVFVLN